MYMCTFVCIHTCIHICIVCMCVYGSLTLEGELGLLLDSRTLGGKLVQQDWRNTAGPQKKQASQALESTACP